MIVSSESEDEFRLPSPSSPAAASASSLEYAAPRSRRAFPFHPFVSPAPSFLPALRLPSSLELTSSSSSSSSSSVVDALLSELLELLEVLLLLSLSLLLLVEEPLDDELREEELDMLSSLSAPV